MKTLLRFTFAVFLSATPLSAAADTLRVIATVPDLADIARRIGGNRIEVSSIATGVEDPHSVPMKPSYAMRLNRADLLLVQGLELEHAFLPGLLEAARNPKIQRGAPGYIDCSVYVTPLEVPARLDRAEGEQHPLGNPHYNLDPEQGKKAARAIAEGFSRAIPEGAPDFQENLRRFDSELDAAIAGWKKEWEQLKGARYVSYHPDFIYLAAWLGMKEAGTIELKAGVDPTPSHIAELQESMKRDGVELLIRERHYPAELANTVASATGAALVDLPIMTGGVPEGGDYFSFIGYNVRKLSEAMRGRRERR